MSRVEDVSPHHVLTAKELADIEGLVPDVSGAAGPSVGKLLQLLVNNVRNGRIALNAAVERIGLNGMAKEGT